MRKLLSVQGNANQRCANFAGMARSYREVRMESGNLDLLQSSETGRSDLPRVWSPSSKGRLITGHGCAVLCAPVRRTGTLCRPIPRRLKHVKMQVRRQTQNPSTLG